MVSYIYRRDPIGNPKHWNCISHSMTALLPMLLPSSILPPPLSHNAFFPARENLAQFKKMYYFIFSSLKLHKWGSVCNGNRSVSIQLWSCWTNTTLEKRKVSCWANTHELPNHSGLKKKGIAGIMLGSSTRGLEEMRHKVPLTFSHMAQKKKRYEYCTWRLHRVPEKPIINI
jgi:hypothetical protein